MVEKNWNEQFFEKEEFQDIYNKDYVLELLEDDEINPVEAGFLEGYMKLNT